MTSKPVLAARKILSDLYITSPSEIDLEGIINLHGGYYNETSMSGADGRIVFKNEAAIITVNNNIQFKQRKRFVIAHELGHLVLHKNFQPLFNCTQAVFLEWNKTGSHEYEANEFAAELLLPVTLFQTYIKSFRTFNFELIKSAANYFDTSITSSAIRFTEHGSFPLAIIYSQAGIVRWSRKSTDFICKYPIPKNGNPIPQFSVTNEYYKTGISSNEAELINHGIWFNDYNIEQSIYFYEYCMPIKSLNAALSFVWLAEDKNRIHSKGIRRYNDDY